MTQEVTIQKLLAKLKKLKVQVPEGASVEELQKLLADAEAAKKAEKEAAPKEDATETEDESDEGESEDEPEEVPEKVSAAPVMLEQRGKFRLFLEGKKFKIIDDYARVISQGMTNESEARKLLSDLVRK